jgi:hypothetical protein
MLRSARQLRDRRRPNGILVTIRRRGTDQGHRGLVAVPFGDCVPIKALRAWLEAAGIESGPIFRPVLKGRHVSPHRLSGAFRGQHREAQGQLLGLDPRPVHRSFAQSRIRNVGRRTR